MIGRIIGVLVAILLAVIALYVSRFWVFDLWGRDGLFGVEYLRPGGDILRRELRGTEAAPYDLLIWVIGGFLLLTGFERVWNWLTHKPE
ncbi:MAG: hypothetical protein AAF401_00720 [Pseudomonadota bacterium]